ncbi:MAG TPA: outer membrane lipoprotein carrier protein LolA [Bryobacteraceae bacterium]|jgi:outer membrane lipoprotein-sorting protein|nr:outer membrane lipoprotein carrier protein LolA [Bryobacteraceae bacterium]
MARWLVLAALALPLGAQTGGSLNEAFARLDKTSQQFHSMTADIARIVHTAIVNADDKDSGTIKVKIEKNHDTRMLIDFTAPNAQAVSIDSSEASLYYPKIKTEQIYNIGSRKALVEQFLLLGFGASSAALKESYDITLVGMEKIGADDTWHLQLIPKTKEVLQRLKKAELWIAESSGLPAQQRFVTSAAGDFHLVTYSNMKVNPPLSDGALKLNLPKGVTVEHPQF